MRPRYRENRDYEAFDSTRIGVDVRYVMQAQTLLHDCRNRDTVIVDECDTSRRTSAPRILPTDHLRRRLFLLVHPEFAY
jgi:hypothetical protein